MPYWVTCWFLELYLNSVFNHEDYQLRPKHRCLSQHIMVNDALPNRILSGTVTVKGDIDYLTETGVVFKGETTPVPCDVLVKATGYKVVFPFISEELVPVHKNKVRLYKWQFIPNIKHAHTLAFISLAQPIGALLPIGELQSRWFALLMAGKLKLPSREEMEADLREKEKFQERFYESERHTIQVDWVPFMDELSKEIGAYPFIWKYVFTDPKLFFALLFGACAPYQYRLTGPNKWSGALKIVCSRATILNVTVSVCSCLLALKISIVNVRIFRPDGLLLCSNEGLHESKLLI
ncbi:PREDICTED: dimethylaniline monooxygenase [N-oxide-forming] 5-like [Rhagoletis zephyria]|uniref:dimethylaniline monooxygenase [N-oxide-forming] 5-like n=1 Tax=Rhagoletis zephyria TaxID=28612 RepID=UPI0008114981|nr:PREDICTED: dimethylaniline monooxygenase [N-oxide-forming] 5-like [Rhagoletis zephyria]